MDFHGGECTLCLFAHAIGVLHAAVFEDALVFADVVDAGGWEVAEWGLHVVVGDAGGFVLGLHVGNTHQACVWCMLLGQGGAGGAANAEQYK